VAAALTVCGSGGGGGAGWWGGFPAVVMWVSLSARLRRQEMSVAEIVLAGMGFGGQYYGVTTWWWFAGGGWAGQVCCGG
jgi:hypothetical protein